MRHRVMHPPFTRVRPKEKGFRYFGNRKDFQRNTRGIRGKLWTKIEKNFSKVEEILRKIEEILRETEEILRKIEDKKMI